MNRNDWHAIESLARYYARNNPPDGTALMWQLLKIQEEMGEVVQSFIGYCGQNPRKADIMVPLEDVVQEICDVIITGYVALATATVDPERHLDERWTMIKERTVRFYDGQ